MNLRPSHRRTLFFGFAILLLALNAACSAFPPAAQLHAANTETPARALAGVKADLSFAPAPQGRSNAQPAESTPPVLVATEPQDGATWAGEPVTLAFDRPLPADFADQLSIEPPLPGSAAVEGNSLIFSAEQTPEPGTRYTFSVAAAAGSAPQSITLPGAFPLSVTATQPSQGAADVAPSTQIVAIFNRPVVPLTGIDEQAKLPQPLTIEPAVAGVGKWINTSVYALQPDAPLAGATAYTVTVDNITAVGGEALAEPVIFSFTTAAPIVVSANPMGNLVQPSASVRVDFSQPMDVASTEAAFSLRQTWDDAAPPVAGDFGWENASATLVFTPTEPLEFGQSYSINVAEDALAAGGEGHLREAFSSLFTVVPFPAVAGVFPVDHATNVPPDTDVTIRFNTEVSQTLVLQNVTISPMLTSTQVYSYYSIWDNTLNLSWFKEPQTRYTVTVGAAIADPFGNTLGDDLQFSFTTGDYSPYAKLELSRFTHFNAATPPRIGVLFRNVDSIAVELYRLPQTELFKLTGSNEWEAWQDYAVPNADANRIWRREYDTSDNLNISVRQIVTVTDAAGDVLPPGAYFMSVTSPQIQTVENATSRDNPSQAAIFLSNANLLIKKSEQGDSLAWLTDLNSGAPIADANISFYADGDLLGESATDDTGVTVARLELPQEKMWTPVLALSGEPGQPDYAVVSSNWSDGIATWEFNINGGWGASPIQAYFYTERPIYRPGHTVYWKGIVRTLVDDDYQLPPPNTVISVTIRDDMGNPIHEAVQTLGPHGTVDGELQLSPEAHTGYYYLEARLAQGDQNIPLSGQGFEVVSYRTPEFEISVDALQDEYVQGDTVQVRATAAYFSGGPLVNASVSWRLISDPYFFNWSGEDGNRYFSFMPFDSDQEEYDPYSGNFSLGLVQEGEGVTDANGEFLIELPADIGRSRQSQSWTFDVTVQSSSNQFVSSSVAVPIHRAAYYVGLSPWAYLSRAGEPAQIDVVSITPQQDAYAGAVIDAVVYNYQANSVYERAADGAYRWVTTIERTPVFTTTITTDHQGMAVIEWTPEAGGRYQIVAQSTDEAGNPVSSTAFVWVSAAQGDEFVAWPRENNDRIDLVADKKLYAPGETAKILVPSPFTAPVQALVTIERGGVLEQKVITLTANSETLEIPISARYIPNVYVGVVLVKGVDETNPTSAMRVGYVKLPVDTSERELNIAITPSAETVRPSDTVSYTLTVTDNAGEPVPNAEVSAALVDKAVLSLYASYDQRLIDAFYYERPLDVTTGVLLIINQDRVSQQLSEGAKGGGGGGPGGGLEVRQDFADVAFWRADLITNDKGEIRFSVDLPDNLTTWRLSAKGITDDTMVGESVGDVVAAKELQIRPILPRFFTAGDRAYIGAALINSSSQAITDGTLSFAVSGAELTGTAPATVSFALKPGEQMVQTWPVEVVALSGAVTVTLEASGTGSEDAILADAVRMILPVKRYESHETVSTAGSVPPGGVAEAIVLPAAVTDSGELNVTVEPSLAGGMLSGLDYLAHYPYECNEQTVSRFLPNLMTMRAFQTLGIADPELENQLAYQIGIGVQRLVSRQNPDGGWGYWPGEESAPFISAYVLWGLSSADAMHYTVPADTLRNAVSYLESQFQAPSNTDAAWELNEMAFMHYVLAEMGEGDPGRAATLYDARERLDLYGKALLALALADMDPAGAASPQVRTLLDDIAGAAQISAAGAWWAETSIDFRTLNTDTRTTSIVLEAFTRLKPNYPLLPEVVHWLMVTRETGRWATTQENAWAIIALTDWLQASGELEADYDWQVTLNDESIGEGTVTPANLNDPVQMRVAVADMLRGEANLLNFGRSNDHGQMYYTADLQYYVDATAIESRDRGIVVARTFALAGDAAQQPINSAKVGDVISVTVTLVAPTDLFHVLVETPIPAGVEPIDPRLATTSNQYDMPSVTALDAPDSFSWWRYWTPSNTDIRDDKVALFATYLPAGAYQYTFNARVSIPGEYRVLPARAEMMYFNDVWGRSAGALFTVTDRTASD